MKLKPIMKYQLHLNYQIFRIMYGVIYSITLAAVITRLLNQGSSVTECAELATMITIFVTGLTTFKESFRFFVSSGVSRKRFFMGLLASLGCTAIVTALIDTINSVIFSLFLNYHPIYEALGSQSKIEMSVSMNNIHAGGFLLKIPFTPLFLLKNFLWCAFAYFALAIIGFFITTLYYRMNKQLKILVSVGVPAFFFILLPFLNQYVADGKIGQFFATIFGWWMQCATNPAADMATRLVFAAVFAGLAFLLMRRTDVKA